MFNNMAPPNIGPQVPIHLINDPAAYQTQLHEFARDLKIWWQKHCHHLQPSGYENRKAYYKMRSMNTDIRLPESLIEWLKAADIIRDRRAWKAIEKSILSARLFQSANGE